MNAFSQIIRPFIWRPSGFVPSMELLDASHGVVAKRDVTAAVGGQCQERHPLAVVELARGKIIGNLRLAATADDVVIGGVQSLFGCAEPQNHYLPRRRRFRIPKFRHGTALLLGAGNSDNYYHWLLDSLPRWKMLLAADYRDYDYVLLHSQPCRFQEETLERLGVPEAKRLRCSKNFVHQFDRLVLPAMISPPWQTEAWACIWIRSLFPQGGVGPEKIYLSRRDAHRRRLVNEAEIDAQLQGLGFVSVQTEQLTIAEQAKLFGAAKCVVAPHGAGLANLVFAPPGAQLIELFHPDNRTPCYQNLAAACGHRYAAFTGTRFRAPVRHEEQAEFTIEVPILLRTLAELNMISI